ncbi:hypothetical protein [Lactococcus cremoris]|uniref:hypothetical protein n=1 Tax=Lactococcus lactis subsp. cremoris TaxID=1359 RepID=UPI002FCA0CE9
MKMNKKIEEIMFEDLKKKFPDHNYSLDFYQEIMENPSVNALLDLAHYQISESFGLLITSYGWYFRDFKNPETGTDFDELENREDEIFGEFIKFFDFFYNYKIYSSKYKKCTFNEYLKDKNQDIN